MGLRRLPPELLFETALFVSAEHAIPNVLPSCRLLHNFLSSRVEKWATLFKKMSSESLRKEMTEMKANMTELRKELETAKKEAVEAKKEAVEAKKEAVEAKKEAVEAKKEAVEAKKEAGDKSKSIELIVKGFMPLFNAIREHIVDDVAGTVRDTGTGRVYDSATATRQGLVKEADSSGGVLSGTSSGLGGSICAAAATTMTPSRQIRNFMNEYSEMAEGVLVVDKMFHTLFHFKRRFVIKGARLLYPKEVSLQMAHDLLKRAGVDQENLVVRLSMEEFAVLTVCYEKQCQEMPGLFHYDHRHPKTVKMLAEDDPFPPKYSKSTIELDQIDNEGMTLDQFDIFGWVREGNAFQVRVWLDDSEHDLNVGDDHAFSLLHWASKEGHVSIVEMLLSRGARVNATNMGDDTALHLAAAHGHRQIVVKLLLRKAEVNIQNEHGMTPLHYACFWGYEQICEDLIRSGALTTMCNKRGLTPLDVCQPQVRQSVYEIALSNGQNPQQKIQYSGDAWQNTKTFRSRDATWSCYTGVDLQSLALTKQIAQSHSGTLYRGKWQSNDIVARVLNVPNVTERIARDFSTEFLQLRIFASAFVNPVLAVVNQPPQLIVISQFMPFGSLYNVLHEQSSVVIDQHQAIRFSLDIARGMSFLHSLDQPVLRYYLSSKHVVIDEDLSAKISMADTKFSFQEVGRLYSPAWMAPEALQRSPETLNTRAADMWSFGILLWELNTREVPFSDLSPMEIGMKIALEGLRVTIPPGISRNMFRLINICLNEDPGRRPNFDQIIPILEKMGH